MHYTENLRTDKTLKGIGNNHENCSLRFGHGLEPIHHKLTERITAMKKRNIVIRSFCASYADRRRQGSNHP